jgi:hypothetical protein
LHCRLGDVRVDRWSASGHEIRHAFLDDLAIAADGTVWFSDVSRRFDQHHWMLDFLEGRVVLNLQDPARTCGPVTSVTETNGRLYFGSIGTAAIGWASAP